MGRSPEAAELGLDEAGRGSVLGPLVLGGFLCDRECSARLAGIGVRDSKRLTPSRRTELAAQLATMGECWSMAIPPSAIDSAVNEHGLNRLEAEGFARLIRASGPATVAVDACDVRPERFGETIRRLSGFRGPIDARHHADRDLPIVGAASIVAKTRRDDLVARIGPVAGLPPGSGYPSDARTVAFVRAALSGAEALPQGVLRRSWATTGRVIRERAAVPLERFAR